VSADLSRPVRVWAVKRALLSLVLCGLVVLGVLVASQLAGSPVSAQDSNSLQAIQPVNGATLDTSPVAIVLSFNQELRSTDLVRVSLSCGNNPGNLATPKVDDEGLIVTVELLSPVPKGACNVSWSLAAADGTVLLGPELTTFRVNSDPPPTTTTVGQAGAPTTTSAFIQLDPTQATSGDAAATPNQGSNGGALWLGRLLSTLGILALFGGLALIAIGWPEGPEYVVTVRYLRAMWVLAVVGTILYLIAYSAKYADTSFGAAMSPNTWLDLKDDGWPGRGALLRLAFVLASGWVAMRPERIIDPTSAMWAWAIPGASLGAVALSRVEGPAAWIGVLIGFAHVLVVAVWFGGVALVARVVLAGPGEEDLLHATRAFSRMSTKAMVATVITGIAQMLRLVGNPFSSSHGQVLLLKCVAVAAMVAVGLEARRQVGYRLDRAHEMTVPLADRFRRAFGAEAAIGVVVLAFSGWMLALTPAKVDPLADETYVRELSFIDPATGIDAKVLIGPATVGLNGFRIEVEAPQDGITNLALHFIPPDPTVNPSILQTIPLTTAGTVVLDDAVGLPFNVPGTWTLELIASTALGTQTGARTEFVVAAADGTTPTVPAATLPVGSPVVSSVIPVTTSPGFVTTTTPQVSGTSTSVPAD
jgi:copper transport protein